MMLVVRVVATIDLAEIVVAVWCLIPSSTLGVQSLGVVVHH
jgi:hypothetical protein